MFQSFLNNYFLDNIQNIIFVVVIEHRFDWPRDHISTESKTVVLYTNLEVSALKKVLPHYPI